MASPETLQIEVRISFAWWLRWYLDGVVLMARMTGREPDMLKVGRWIRRGTKAEAIK
jgi:hypothetical protein